jgi:hypothetical protein
MKKMIKGMAVGLLTLLPGALLQAAEVTLEVLNPRGVIPPPPFHAPSERVGDLDGKTVGIYWIGKAGGDNFWDGIETLIHEQYPNTKVKRYQGVFDLGDERAAQIVKEVDTVLYGVGD